MSDFLPIVVIFFVVLVFARGNEIIPFFQSIPDKIEKIFQTNEPIAERQDINLVTLHCSMTCSSGYKPGVFGPRCKIPPNNPIQREPLTSTYPAAGVIATRPEITPEERPIKEGFF